VVNFIFFYKKFYVVERVDHIPSTPLPKFAVAILPLYNLNTTMETTKIVWVSKTDSGHWIGCRAQQGEFFYTSAVLVTAEYFATLAIGDEIEVPTKCLR
jgi:hypothetical protein